MTSSFIPRSRDETWCAFTLAWMNYLLNCMASAFKSTDLIYIHCVSKENFAITVKGFTYVSLVCREVHKLCGKHMWTKISHPYSCCEFACGQIICWGKKPWADTNKFFLWYHGNFSRFCDCFRLVNWKKWSPELLLCFNYMRYRRGVRFVLKQWAYYF